jgi:hypothetical protein
MSNQRASVYRTVILFLLLVCGGLLVAVSGGTQVAASALAPNNTSTATVTGTPPTSAPTNSRTSTNTRTVTSTRTPTATPDCDDWRQIASVTSGELINPLYGVAVAAPDDVWSVGFDGGYGSTHPHVLVEHWDGTEWSLQSVTNTGILEGVTVVAPDDVWAVGYYEDPAETLTMHWDGENWSTIPSPSDTGVSNNLYGVAAAGPNDVWAVGNARNQARTLHWDGVIWKIVPTPEFEYSFLMAVAVVGPDDVWAVGSEGIYDHTTLILHWDGTEWTRVESPNPASYSNRLEAISVVAANNIWAAGWATEGGSIYRGTMLHWNGVQWSVVPISTDSPDTTGSYQLFGVAAASSTEAWAVGWGLDSTARKNVILQWDGSAWTRINSPNPSSYYNQLEAVAAVAPGEAWAVGHVARSTGTYYDPQILRYGPPCGGTPTATVTGTPPTATGTRTPTRTRTATNTPIPTNTATAIPTICNTSFFEGFESGTLGQFTSSVPICVPGGCGWVASTATPFTGGRSAFAPNPSNITDQRLLLSNPVSVVAGTELTFLHIYNLEEDFDGGVLEASTNGGTSWSDMRVNITSGGYNGVISDAFNNPLHGRPAWTGNSGGYTRVVVNLTPYAGQDLLFRFRLGTDDSLAASGWYIDHITVGSGLCPTSTPGGPTETAVASTATSTSILSTATDTPLVATGTAVATDTTSTPVLPTTTGTAVVSTATSTPEEPTLTVTAIPTEEACQVQFSDVQPGDTFYSQIMCLACNGLMSGYSDGTFRPYNEVTRGQLAKIVSIASGFTETTSNQTFEDVPVGSTFHLYVERMASRGIVGGYPCGGSESEPCGPDNKPYFRPNSDANRGQISKIIATAAHLSGLLNTPAGQPDDGQMFEDVTPSNTYYEWVQMLASHGMIGGYQCGGEGEPCGPTNMPYFRTYNNANRGQASKIVANTYYPSCQTR